METKPRLAAHSIQRTLARALRNISRPFEGKRWCRNCKDIGSLVPAADNSPLCLNCEYDPQYFGFYRLHQNAAAVDRIVNPEVRHNLASKIYERGWEELERNAAPSEVLPFPKSVGKALGGARDAAALYARKARALLAKEG